MVCVGVVARYTLHTCARLTKNTIWIRRGGAGSMTCISQLFSTLVDSQGLKKVANRSYTDTSEPRPHKMKKNAADMTHDFYVYYDASHQPYFWHGIPACLRASD
jgi:hypothetical protein